MKREVRFAQQRLEILRQQEEVARNAVQKGLESRNSLLEVERRKTEALREADNAEAQFEQLMKAKKLIESASQQAEPQTESSDNEGDTVPTAVDVSVSP